MHPFPALIVADAVARVAVVARQGASRVEDLSNNGLDIPEIIHDLCARLNLLASVSFRIRASILEDADLYPEDSMVTLLLYMEGAGERCKEAVSLIIGSLPTDTETSAEDMAAALAKLEQHQSIVEVVEKVGCVLNYLINFQITLGINPQRTLAGGTDHLESKTFSSVPPRGIDNYIGRKATLAEITGTLAARPQLELRVLVLQGSSGQGKTQTALEYCRRMKEAGTYSGIFWVDASAKASITAGFQTIAELLKAPDELIPEVTTQVTYVKSILSEWPKPWIIVFDNYNVGRYDDDPSDFDIAGFFPRSATGHILITTKNPEPKAQGRIIKLDGMKESDAIMLLASTAGFGHKENVDLSRKIVNDLGYSPHAIKQAGVYLREKKIPSLDEFEQVYKDHLSGVNARVMDVLGEVCGLESAEQTGLPLSAFNTWDMLFLLLDPRSEQGRKRAAVLDLMVFFNEEDISEELFHSYLGVKCDVTQPIWLDEFVDKDGEWSSDKFEETMLQFKNLSLVESVGKRDGFLHVSIHPSIKLWILLGQDKETKIANARLASEMLACTIMKTYWEPADLLLEYGFRIPATQANEYLRHLLVWRYNWESFLKPVGPNIVIPKDETKAALCVEHSLALFLNFYEWFDPVLTLCEWILDQCNPKVLLLQPIIIKSRALLIRRNLTMRRFTVAESHARKQLKIFEDLLEPESRLIETCKLALIVALERSERVFQFKRKVKERIELCRGVYAAAKERREGTEVTTEYVAYSVELASILIESPTSEHQTEGGEMLTALSAELKDINIRDYNWSDRTLSCLVSNTPDIEDKKRYSEELLEITRGRYGDVHPTTQDAFGWRGWVLTAAGSNEEAKEMTTRCLTQIQNSETHYFPRIWYLSLMGDILAAEGDFEASVASHHAALQGLSLPSSELVMLSASGHNLLSKMATSCLSARYFDKANTVWTVRLDISQTSGNSEEAVTDLVELGRTNVWMDSPEKIKEGLNYLTEALELFLKLKSKSVSPPDGEEANSQTCDRGDDCDCAILHEKAGFFYGLYIHSFRALGLCKIEEFEEAEATFGKATHAWETLKDKDEDQGRFFFAEVAALGSYFKEQSGKPVNGCFVSLEWVIKVAAELLGEEDSLVQDAKKSLADFRAWSPTDSTQTTEGATERSEEPGEAVETPETQEEASTSNSGQGGAVPTVVVTSAPSVAEPPMSPNSERKRLHRRSISLSWRSKSATAALVGAGKVAIVPTNNKLSKAFKPTLRSKIARLYKHIPTAVSSATSSK